SGRLAESTQLRKLGSCVSFSVAMALFFLRHLCCAFEWHESADPLESHHAPAARMKARSAGIRDRTRIALRVTRAPESMQSNRFID
ncbi:MAG TPA: hypothetical protein VFR86_00855, partial [Burkholderiaceae bacterium]|nr:hypothetical protein [Burkholderiaceae bacterium]